MDVDEPSSSQSTDNGKQVVNFYDYMESVGDVMKEENVLELELEQEPSADDDCERRLVIDNQDEVNAAVLTLLTDARSHQHHQHTSKDDDNDPLMTHRHHSEVNDAVSSLLASEMSFKHLQDTDDRDQNSKNFTHVDEEERKYQRQMAVEVALSLPELQQSLPSTKDSRSRNLAKKKLMTTMPQQLQCFGRYVAGELESMSVDRAIEAQHKIMEILLEAQLDR